MNSEEHRQDISGFPDSEAGRRTQVLLLERADLLAIDGPMAGTRHPVGPGQTRVGRSDQTLEHNDIILATDLKASKLHFIIEGRGGRYVIFDRVSRNRTFVNRHKLAKDEDFPLAFGDEIEAGASTFRLVRAGDEDWGLPRKAGSFWTRRGPGVLLVASVLAAGLLALFGVSSVRYLALAARKPGRVQLQEVAYRVVAATADSVDWKYQFAPAMFWIPDSGCCGIATVGPDSALLVLDGRDLGELWVHRDEKVEPARSIAVDDITHDGWAEVVFLTPSGRLVALAGNSGFSVWRGRYLAGNLSSPSIGDIDGDGDADIFVTDVTGRMMVGRVRPGRVDFEELCWLRDELPAAPSLLPRVRGDSSELVVVSSCGKLYRVDAAGGVTSDDFPAARIAQMTGVSGARVLSAAAVWSGRERSVWTMDRSVGLALGLSIADTAGVKVIVANPVYSSVGSVPGSGAPFRQPAPAIADLNNDRHPDVVVASLAGPLVGLDGSTGEVLFRVHAPDQWQYLLAPPVLYDFDKDGVADVLFCDDRGGVHIVSGSEGAIIAESPATGTSICVSPLVGDVNGDGLVEVVVQDSRGGIRVLATGSSTPDRHPAWPMANGGPGRRNAVLSTAFRTGPRLVYVAVACSVLMILLLANVLWLAFRTARRRRLASRSAH